MLATAGGVGYLPRAPGTWGSLLAVAAAWVLSVFPWWWLVAIPLAIGIGWLSCPGACRHFDNKDPSQVVIDEVAGQWIALAGLPLNPVTLIAGFALFRLFDILKPWPVGRLERFPGASGIMLDDLAAGLIAQLILRFVLYWMG
jgi:phosphatidylglycerophosphatase A